MGFLADTYDTSITNQAQAFVIKGQEYMEKALGNNTFTWLFDNNQYPCVASIVDYKRELDEGGFTIDKLLNMTVRQFDSFGNPVFVNGIPQSQQKLIFTGQTFRILNVEIDNIGTGARIIIHAVCPNRGV